MTYAYRSAALLGAFALSLATASAHQGERDILPQAQPATPVKGQAHCPL
ncbi:hypothetical protein BH11ARM2_BH11ARM2_30410 [soil metagenome]